MSELTDALPKADAKATLEATKQIQELFGVAHDLIAQAQHPGHMGQKVAEALNFLKFQYADFKTRAERLEKQIASEVDVKAARTATEAVLAPQAAQEAPKS